MHHQHNHIDADLPYILDPSYASGSSSRASCSTSASSTTCPLSRTTSSSSSSFYVDDQGNMHDPSYRMFATANPNPKPTTSRPTSRRRRPSKPHRIFAQQPSTEFGDDICESDEDLDSDSIDSYARESFASYRRPSSPLPPRNTRVHSSPRAISSPLPWAPTISGGLPNYSPPDPDSPFTQRTAAVPDETESNADEDAGPVVARPRSNIRSRWSGKHVITATQAPMSKFSHHDDTCTSSSQPQLSPVKQHWEAATLRLQFGLYHARQKLATHLTSSAAGPRDGPHVGSRVLSF